MSHTSLFIEFYVQRQYLLLMNWKVLQYACSTSFLLIHSFFQYILTSGAASGVKTENVCSRFSCSTKWEETFIVWRSTGGGHWPHIWQGTDLIFGKGRPICLRILLYQLFKLYTKPVERSEIPLWCGYVDFRQLLVLKLMLSSNKWWQFYQVKKGKSVSLKILLS